MGKHARRGKKAKQRRKIARALAQVEAVSGTNRTANRAARRLVRCVGEAFEVAPSVDLSDLSLCTVVTFLYRRKAAGQLVAQPHHPIEEPLGEPLGDEVEPVIGDDDDNGGGVDCRHGVTALRRLRQQRDAARVANGLVVRTARGRVSRLVLQERDQGRLPLISLVDLTRLTQRDAEHSRAARAWRAGSGRHETTMARSGRENQERKRKIARAGTLAEKRKTRHANQQLRLDRKEVKGVVRELVSAVVSTHKAEMVANKFGVRLERRVDLGPLLPARDALPAAEREAVLRAFCEFKGRFNGEHVFVREILFDGFRDPGSPVSKTLRQFRARFAEGNTTPLDVTIVSVVARVCILGLVLKGFQRYYYGGLDHIPHECISLSELEDFVNQCCDAGIPCEFALPETVDPMSLPDELRDASKWTHLVSHFDRRAKAQRGNRTFPRGFTTMKCKIPFINGGHPELSDSDIPAELSSSYAEFIVAALQYLTRCSPTCQTSRGGLHFARVLAACNKYEAFALGLFVGKLSSHVDVFNDWRPGHDEMGALCYTYYDHVRQRSERICFFAYPRRCVGDYLDSWVNRWHGQLSDFDGPSFPAMPEYVEEQKRKFRADVIAAAKVLLERTYPSKGELSGLPHFGMATWNRLDFIGPNIGVYYWNPSISNASPDLALCFCLCAATCSCATVGMGCSLSVPQTKDVASLLCWIVRFHLRWRSAYCDDGEWCRWGNFAAPHGPGIASTYDRFQRTHGMMQDIGMFPCVARYFYKLSVSATMFLVQMQLWRTMSPKPENCCRVCRR